MKSLTGLACPNKWCSRKAGSPELVASGIWFAELISQKGTNHFMLLLSEGVVGLLCSLRQTSACEAGQGAGQPGHLALLGLFETPALLQFCSLTLDA